MVDKADLGRSLLIPCISYRAVGADSFQRLDIEITR